MPRLTSPEKFGGPCPGDGSQPANRVEQTQASSNRARGRRSRDCWPDLSIHQLREALCSAVIISPVETPVLRLLFLPEPELSGARPWIRRRDLLRWKLLDVRRQRVLGECASPLAVRLIAELADIGDKVPDDGIRKNGPPSRHSIRPPLVNREIDIFRRGAVYVEVVAEGG